LGPGDSIKGTSKKRREGLPYLGQRRSGEGQKQEEGKVLSFFFGDTRQIKSLIRRRRRGPLLLYRDTLRKREKGRKKASRSSLSKERKRKGRKGVPSQRCSLEGKGGKGGKKSSPSLFSSSALVGEGREKKKNSLWTRKKKGRILSPFYSPNEWVAGREALITNLRFLPIRGRRRKKNFLLYTLICRGRKKKKL